PEPTLAAVPSPAPTPDDPSRAPATTPGSSNSSRSASGSTEGCSPSPSRRRSTATPIPPATNPAPTPPAATSTARRPTGRPNGVVRAARVGAVDASGTDPEVRVAASMAPDVRVLGTGPDDPTRPEVRVGAFAARVSACTSTDGAVGPD